MPYLARPDGVKIHWEERGSGPPVVLAPYANGNPAVYDPLEAELAVDHRVVRYDDRGTGASDRSGPFDMDTGADDLEAVLEEVGGPAVVITLGDAVHRAARVTARRPDLVDALVVPGGTPAGRKRLEGSDAMVASDSVLDAFFGMAATDYRGAVRRAWSEDDATEPGRDCGDRLWLLYSEDLTGGWFPAGEEGRRLARRLFPDAHVEEIEDGMISRPDLVGAVVRRVTATARAAG
jgi:pimeloyl-ACP methyl ester carboxylesterase